MIFSPGQSPFFFPRHEPKRPHRLGKREGGLGSKTPSLRGGGEIVVGFGVEESKSTPGGFG